MKTLILGVGRQGGHILELLLQKGYTGVHVFDNKYGPLEDAGRRFSERGVSIVREDLFSMTDHQRIGFLGKYDCIIDALPAQYSWKILHAAAHTGAKTISISFLEEDFMGLHETAQKHHGLLIPDCGAAPGLSHLLAGYSVKRLNGAERVMMKLGAIPLDPKPPFGHNITWSVDDLLQEYIRPARFRKNRQPMRMDPLDTVEPEHIFDIHLESFISDGVRSFFASFPDTAEVTERTLRHKGHLDFMKSLQALNLFSAEPERFGETEIAPRDFLARMIEKSFAALPREDYFIMEVSVQNSQRRDVHYYFMEYDHREGLPALVKSVAVTAVETFRLIEDGTIPGSLSGVYPLEQLAEEPVYQRLIQVHRDYGAKYELIRE